MVWHYCSRKELSPSPWGKLYTRTTPKNGKFKDIWLLTLVFFGVDEKSSLILMMHMSFCLANPSHWGGITPTSPSFIFDATHLGGRSISFKTRCLFRLSMLLPILTPNLRTFFVSHLIQVRYIFKRSFPCK